jgi:hypothetical protein
MKTKIIHEIIRTAGFRPFYTSSDAGPIVGIVIEKLIGGGQSEYITVEGLVPIGDEEDWAFAEDLIKRAEEIMKEKGFEHKQFN